MRSAEEAPKPTRRDLLVAACSSGAALAAAFGCTPETPPVSGPAPTKIPFARLPDGARVVLPVHGRPVEFLRSGRDVAARSLLCTHMGCEVAWVEGAASYVCPCHEGRFDAEGQVLAGPPPKPLRLLRVTVSGADLLVEG